MLASVLVLLALVSLFAAVFILVAISGRQFDVVSTDFSISMGFGVSVSGLSGEALPLSGSQVVALCLVQTVSLLILAANTLKARKWAFICVFVGGFVCSMLGVACGGNWELLVPLFLAIYALLRLAGVLPTKQNVN